MSTQKFDAVLRLGDAPTDVPRNWRSCRVQGCGKWIMPYESRYECPPCGLAVLCCDCGLLHEAHGAYPLPPLEEPDDDAGDDDDPSSGDPPQRGGRWLERNRTPPRNDHYRDGVRDMPSGSRWNAPSAVVQAVEPVAQLREVACADPELFGEHATFLPPTHFPSHPAEKIVGGVVPVFLSGRRVLGPPS